MAEDAVNNADGSRTPPRPGRQQPGLPSPRQNGTPSKRQSAYLDGEPLEAEERERRAKEIKREKEMLAINRDTRNVNEVFKQWRGSGPAPTVASWRLFRAAVHVEDAWSRRRQVCPSLESSQEMALFTWRSKLRLLKRLAIYALLVMSLFEVAPWGIGNKKWDWACYPRMPSHLTPKEGLIVDSCLIWVFVADMLMAKKFLGELYWKAERSLMSHAWVQHAFVIIYVVDIIVAWATGGQHARVAGYCRIAIYATMHRRTWSVLRLLLDLAYAVVDIWVLITIFLVTYGWIGRILFQGTDEGFFWFGTPLKGIWSMLVLMTTTNHPAVAVRAYEWHRWSYLYFMSFIIIGVFFLAPMLLAVVYGVFRAADSGRPDEEDRIRRISLAQAFSLLDERQKGWIPLANVRALLREINKFRRITYQEMQGLLDVITTIDLEDHPKIDMQDFQDMMTVLDKQWGQHWMSTVESQYPDLFNAAWFQRLKFFLEEECIQLWGTEPSAVYVRAYDLIDGVLVVATLIVLIVESSHCGPGKIGSAPTLRAKCPADYAQMLLLLLFALLLAVKTVVIGGANCWRDMKFRYDVFFTGASVIMAISALAHPGHTANTPVRVMLLLRLTYVATMVRWVPRFALLLDTLARMTTRAATLISVLWVWAFFMGYLGVQVLGGLVCDPRKQTDVQQCGEGKTFTNSYSGSLYYDFNFNDMGSAMVTLFVLLIKNDWWVISQGHTAGAGNDFPRIFFLFNWAFGVCIAATLITTLVIDTFWDNYQNVYKHLGGAGADPPPGEEGVPLDGGLPAGFQDPSTPSPDDGQAKDASVGAMLEARFREQDPVSRKSQATQLFNMPSFETIESSGLTPEAKAEEAALATQHRQTSLLVEGFG